jgi:hypothetical protein
VLRLIIAHTESIEVRLGEAVEATTVDDVVCVSLLAACLVCRVSVPQCEAVTATFTLDHVLVDLVLARRVVVHVDCFFQRTHRKIRLKLILCKLVAG